MKEKEEKLELSKKKSEKRKKVKKNEERREESGENIKMRYQISIVGIRTRIGRG